jgi:hypothetical protein
VTDTLEKINPRNPGLDTATMALAALAIENADHRPGVRLNEMQVQELLKRTGMAEAAKMDSAAQ